MIQGLRNAAKPIMLLVAAGFLLSACHHWHHRGHGGGGGGGHGHHRGR